MTAASDRLIDRLDTDRTAAGAIGDSFAVWWELHSPDAADLLDALAHRARADRPTMELLLTIIGRHGIARPALHRTLIDPNDLDDAEQSTLAAVGLRLDRFDGRSRFTTWLHTVADNEAKMLIRARARRPATPTDVIETSPFLARLSTILADRDVITRALQSLPEQYRQPIELREVDGLSYSEIADALSLELGTVKSRVSRGRAMLVASLSGERDE